MQSQPISKKKRAPNLSERDKALLSDLCGRYADQIESKKTGALNGKMKEEAWRSLAAEFETATMVPRDWQQLKHVRNIITLDVQCEPVC